MFDLHTHFCGSVNVYDMMAYGLGSDANFNIRDFIITADDKRCKTTADVKKAFYIPLEISQTESAIAAICQNIIFFNKVQANLYVELSISPALHTKGGLSQLKVVKSAIEGLKQGIACANGTIMAKLILVCLKGDEHYDENIETIKLANKFKGKYICGVGISVKRVENVKQKISPLFKLANKYGLPIVAQANPNQVKEDIKEAIDLGARRIVNGFSAIKDPELLAYAVEKHVCFEICPTAIIKHKHFKSLSEIPLSECLKAEALVTINTNGITVNRTTIMEEHAKINKIFNLTKEDTKRFFENSIESSFTSLEEKKFLYTRLNSKFEDYFIVHIH